MNELYGPARLSAPRCTAATPKSQGPKPDGQGCLRLRRTLWIRVFGREASAMAEKDTAGLFWEAA